MEEGPDHLPDLRMKMFDLGELYDGSFLNMDSGIDWSELYKQKKKKEKGGMKRKING